MGSEKLFTKYRYHELLEPTSYVYEHIKTKTESKAENKNLDYDFRVLGELNYTFISLLAIKLVELGVKSFSQSTDIMNSYNQRLTYITPLTRKLKGRQK